MPTKQTKTDAMQQQMDAMMRAGRSKREAMHMVMEQQMANPTPPKRGDMNGRTMRKGK